MIALVQRRAQSRMGLILPLRLAAGRQSRGRA